MPTCKECEWFIYFECGNGVCCCPDQPKDDLPKHFPYKNVTVNTPACNFFGNENDELPGDNNKGRIERESNIMSALENHSYLLDEVQNSIDILFQKLKPILKEGVFESLDQVNKKPAGKAASISLSNNPLVRLVNQLSAKLLKITEYLQVLSRYLDL